LLGSKLSRHLVGAVVASAVVACLGVRLARPAPEKSRVVAANQAADCSARPGKSLGAWVPTDAELVRAASVATLGCVEPNRAVEEVRQCAQQMESGLVRISSTLPISECNTTPRPCTLSTRSAEHQGRRWLVLQSSDLAWFVDEAGCNSVSLIQVSVVEMTEAPVVYFERSYRPDYDEHLACSSEMPADWASLPAELQHFLCAESA
jgi:hypothetical protein